MAARSNPAEVSTKMCMHAHLLREFEREDSPVCLILPQGEGGKLAHCRSTGYFMRLEYAQHPGRERNTGDDGNISS